LGPAGGAGVSNVGTIKSLTNNGAIGGGNGGIGSGAGAGGAGIANSGTISRLTNRGTIDGGNGGTASTGFVNAGGGGVANSGTITSLINSGKISGGNGFGTRGGGGGVSNATGATIRSLSNAIGATIFGGTGGAGLSNAGTIGALTNTGTIRGGAGGSGSTSGAPGDAIYSAGKHASIGPITNSGTIIGNVEIDNQASVTVIGGSGKTFGNWRGGAITGGAITIGNGNLIFASGNTEIDEDISVDGGVGTVSNDSVLRFAAFEVVTGNFTNDGTIQVSSGKLELDGAVTGTGKDTISGPSPPRVPTPECQPQPPSVTRIST
jgi:hypothetical protein